MSDKKPSVLMMEMLRDLEEVSPLLLVGGYVMEFKKRYKKSIHILKTVADVKKFVRDVDGKIFPEIVIELYPELYDFSGLLKFVEEYLGKLVILSHYDVVDEVFLSRIKRTLRSSGKETVMLQPHYVTLEDAEGDIELKTMGLKDPLIWSKYVKHGKSKSVTKCLQILYGGQ